MVSVLKKDSEIRNIENTVHLYIEGLYERKFNLLKQAFWHDSRNIGITAENDFWFKTMEFWKKKCSIPIENNKEENKEIIIESIDYWHNSAIARVKLVVNYPKRIYECTDFLSLLKIDGEWKIFNKLWSARDTLKNDSEG